MRQIGASGQPTPEETSDHLRRAPSPSGQAPSKSAPHYLSLPNVQVSGAGDNVNDMQPQGEERRTLERRPNSWMPVGAADNLCDGRPSPSKMADASGPFQTVLILSNPNNGPMNLRQSCTQRHNDPGTDSVEGCT